MSIHPNAGKLAPKSSLVNVAKLVSDYYILEPDMKESSQRVSFGTSGHRGSSLIKSFNETHILAVSQAVCDYRKSAKIDGILFMGIDTHALSYPAQITAIEVLVANGVNLYIAKDLATHLHLLSRMQYSLTTRMPHLCVMAS
jgi:phosphoglucomutase